MLTIKNWKRLFLEFYDNFGGGVAFTGKLLTGAGGVAGGSTDIGFQLTEGTAYAFEPMRIEGAGIAAAVDLESLSPDFTLERLHLGSEDRTLFGA